MIPHKLFVSSCFNFKFSKPKINIKKEKKINKTILNAINYVLKTNYQLKKYNINKIDKKFFIESEKLLPKNNYVGFSITQGNIYRKKEWPLSNIVKICNMLVQNNKIPVFFIIKKNHELKNKIKIEGFESVAISLSISDSARRGGDLGWINENLISKKLLSPIANTPVGNISEPILLPNGILVFKVRNKRKVERNIDLEEVKNELVNSEKTRILNMHSSSHYNNLRRSISIKFF